MKKALFILILVCAPSAWAANDVYISQSGAGGGTSCNDTKSATYFNTSGNWSATPTGIQIGPDTTVHLCGTWTGMAGGSMLTVQGSGTSGHNVIIKAESGMTASAPYWSASAGFINTNGKNFITLDGAGTGSAVSTLGVGNGTFTPVGTIQNTANGETLGNRQITTFIYAASCNGCVIKNWVLPNAYVTTKNTPNPIGGPATQMSAITYSGQNGQITNNIFHDCGWCILDNYGNNDTGLEVDHNKIWNYNHGLMFAAASAVAATSPALRFHDNQVLDNQNWENTIAGGSSSDCPYHLDGIHIFGTTGNTIDGVYVYNNYFGGAVSACSTGFIFVENGGSPSHILNSAWWNNVFDASNSDVITRSGCVNCGVVGGWVGIFSSQTSILFVNNTILYKNAYDGGAQGFNIGSVTNLTFKNNVSNGFVTGNNIGSLSSTPASQVDRNVYGAACVLSNNCFIYNGSFMGSLATWKSTSGFDTNGLSPSFSGILLGPQGSLIAGSPAAGLGANLSASATGALATLQNDTTLGGTRTPVARPGGATAWDAGAYALSGSSTPSSVPTGLTATNSGSTANLSWSASTGTTPITYNVSRGTASGGPYTQIASGITTTSYADTNLAAATYYYVVSSTNPAGTSANSTQASVTIPPQISIPSAPTNLSAIASGAQIVLSWTAALGTPTGYNVLRSTTSGGPYTTIATLGVVTTYTNSGLSNGTYYYRVNAFNGAGTSPNSNEANATINTQPAANLSPSSLNLGSWVIGQTSSSQSAKLTNVGNATLSSIVIDAPSGTNAADFSSSSNCGSTLAPGAFCTITVNFIPSLGTNEQAAIVVHSNDPAGNDTLLLSGTGTIGVTVNPTSLNFGNQYSNKTSAAQVVTVNNQSGASITFTSVALTSGTQFSISSNGCTGTLANNSFCTVQITFLPTSLGNKSDTLTVAYTGGTGSPQTVSITGTAKKHGVLKVGAAVSWPQPFIKPQIIKI